jgi:hypothetical protein
MFNFLSDFIPDDTGVGVPLPPEDDDVVLNSIDFDEKPVKTLEEKPVKTLEEKPVDDDDDDETFQEKPVEIAAKKEPAKTFEEKQIKKSFQNLFPFPRDRNFDEDDFIRQMENFHFIRYSDIVARSPNFNPFITEPETGTLTTTNRPRVPIRTTPSSFSYSYQNQPVASPLVAEKPRQPFPRQTIPTTTTTTTSTTTTEKTTTTTQKSRSTTTTTPASTSVKSLNRSVFKEMTPPRVPKSFPRFPPQNFQQAALTAQLDFAPKIQVNI